MLTHDGFACSTITVSRRSRRPVTCPGVLSLHGKEGVDGSSPSEGFAKSLQMSRLLVRGLQTAVTRAHSRVSLTFARCSHGASYLA